MIRVVAVGSLAEAGAVADEWDGMRAAGASDVFTSSAWCLAGWRAFPDLGSPLLLLAVDGSGVLLGALPLTAGPKDPAWAASPLGDEHDLRIHPEVPTPAVGSALLRSAPRTSRDGETLLRDVRPGGILAGLARSHAGCPAPFVRLRGPDEEFGALACLPGWSRKRRRTLRSARRHLETVGTVSIQRLTESHLLAEALPNFARSRLGAWKRRGRLAELPAMDRHPHFPEFLGEAGSRLAAGGRCVLLRLLLDDEPLAQALFFRASGADLLYMSTYDPAMTPYSPSHLLIAEAARLAVDDGVRILELGRGDERYKFVLGAEPRHLRDVVLGP
jgi:CelD/BcsL family acetyltransferase involved in cellulose biosynthesis